MKFLILFASVSIMSAIQGQATTKRPGGKDRLQQMKDSMDSGALAKVSMEANFRGGDDAWINYLRNAMRYPDDAIRNKIEGIVVVRFIIDTSGNVIDVHTTSGPQDGGLREEAERVIRESSGKWEPAVQNSRYVKQYLRQALTFK